MSNKDSVEGRLGDVSGRLGDVSGHMGDVSGRLGDVSGRATSAEVQDCLLQDRQADKVRFVEGRMSRIETEVVFLVRWMTAQVQILKTEGSATSDVADAQKRVEDQATRLQDRVETLEAEVKAIKSKLPT